MHQHRSVTMSKPKPYRIIFSDAAKAAAEASSSIAEVEATAREEIRAAVFWPLDEMDLPPWGFHSFEMPDGQRFIALFFGPDSAEIELVEREESVGRIEDKNPDLAEALGLSGEVVFPVAARTKRT